MPVYAYACMKLAHADLEHAYAYVCLHTHALPEVNLIRSSPKPTLGLRILASLENGGSSHKWYKMRCLHVSILVSNTSDMGTWLKSLCSCNIPAIAKNESSRSTWWTKMVQVLWENKMVHEFEKIRAVGCNC